MQTEKAFELDFDIAVYAVNEDRFLASCIKSIDAASEGFRAHINVILNGTTDDSISTLQHTTLSHAKMTVYYLGIADKANAINQYIYKLRNKAHFYISMDAYATIAPGSLSAFRDAFEMNSDAHIVSAVPLRGRSAETVTRMSLQGGVVNGQCYGMRGHFVDHVVAAGIRLPQYLYRVDGLLGSIAAHNTDPLRNPWDNRRIIASKDAKFSIVPLSIFSFRDILRQFKREIKQSRGFLENQAIKAIIYQSGYTALPENADRMVFNLLR
ncbi:MAG TPA: hypothetical protein PLC74_11910, partial [Acetobacteraceae bacterium]|nr:hypothetical protein [Acetobacteraceae bacterium]